ncbi:endonuclease [Flavitalea flava]
MPEGPSIIILKELVQPYKGKKIKQASGNAKIDMDLLRDQKIIDFKSWGKHFLVCLPKLTLRIHFLLFGSYSIDELTKPKPRLHLQFSKGSLYFYSCSIRILEGTPDEVYDWSGDIMNDCWDPKKARKKLKMMPETIVADALLDQSVFAGVGNIIKNEVLFRIRVHPETKIRNLPPRKLTELIKEARNYSFDFLRWKKAFELKKHWLAHTKKICPRCHIPFVKLPHLGKTKRRAFFCENCQILYSPDSPAK